MSHWAFEESLRSAASPSYLVQKAKLLFELLAHETSLHSLDFRPLTEPSASAAPRNDRHLELQIKLAASLCSLPPSLEIQSPDQVSYGGSSHELPEYKRSNARAARVDCSNLKLLAELVANRQLLVRTRSDCCPAAGCLNTRSNFGCSA